MISVIGTGSMGSAIAEGLLKAGNLVTVYNRTPLKAKSLQSMGASVAADPASAILAADLVILVLFDAAATRDIFAADGVSEALSGRSVINVAATSVDEVSSLAAFVAAAGGNLSEVTIVDYPPAVRDRAGEFIIASDEEHAERWLALFRNLGTKVHHIGTVGNASRAEMAVWMPYMFQTLSISYILAAFEKLGLSVDILRSMMRDNAVLQNPAAETMIPVMTSRAYGTDMFSVDNFIATCDMVTDFARDLDLPTDVFRAVRDVYVKASARGFGGRDVAAIYEVMFPAAVRTE